MNTTNAQTGTTNETIEPKSVPIPRWLVRNVWRGHRAIYAMSRGRLGLRTPTPERYGMLRLRTMGRRSGRERGAILAYFQDGADLVIVPMNGWADPEPGWWLNLQADPEASVDTPDGSHAVVARVAGPVDHDRLWAAAAGPWGKDLDAYAAGRARETQVVILAPSERSAS